MAKQIPDNLEEKQSLVLAQGEAYTQALSLMKQMDPSHAAITVDYYIITFVCEDAEGMYMVQPEGDLQWQIPKEHDNAHLEIAVQDHEDRRFVPSLSVSIKLKTTQGNDVIDTELPFLWHPFLYHYGSDVHIPEEGDYTIVVTIDEPTFGRHDEDKGKRYTKGVTATLGPVHLKPGRKEYGPE